MWWSALLSVGWPLDAVAERFYRSVGVHASAGTFSSSVQMICLTQGDPLPLSHDTCLGAQGTRVDFADHHTRVAWRNLHAELIQRLKLIGASVVAFDLVFDKPADQCSSADRDLARAIREAETRGKTRVIIGVEEGEVDSRKGAPANLSDSLRDAIGSYWGLINVGGIHENELGYFLLAEACAPYSFPADGTLGAIPSLPLRAKLAIMEQGKPRSSTVSMDLKRRELILRTANGDQEKIACDIRVVVEGKSLRRYLAFIPLRVPSEAVLKNKTSRYGDAYRSSLTEHRQKIILVGSGIGQEDQYSIAPDGRPVYGFQVHAAVLSDLVEGTCPHHPGPVFQMLGFLIVCVLTSSARLSRRLRIAIDVPRLREWIGEVPLALLIVAVVYVIAAGFLYNFAHLSLESSYYLLVAVLGYFGSGGILLRQRDKTASWNIA